MALPPLAIDPGVAERSRLLNDTRCAEPLAHYRILLPPRFRAVDRECRAPSHEHSPVSVSLFRTVDGPLTEVEVIGFFLRREVAPVDVLRPLLKDHAILDERRVPSRGGELLDVLTRKAGPAPYLARWWTVKDGGAEGGRLYVVQGRVAEAAYPEVAGELSSMLASFRLLNPTPWDYFEQLASLVQKTPNDILCFYPESWQLMVASDGSEGPYLAHLVQLIAGQLLGRMTILSTAGTDAPESVRDTYASSLGAAVEWGPIEEAEPFAGLERAWTSRGGAALDDTAVEVTAHIGQRAGATVLLGVAGIPASVDPLAAGTVRRALDIVRETFRIA